MTFLFAHAFAASVHDLMHHEDTQLVKEALKNLKVKENPLTPAARNRGAHYGMVVLRCFFQQAKEFVF